MDLSPQSIEDQNSGKLKKMSPEQVVYMNLQYSHETLVSRYPFLTAVN